jgi:mRNA interferase MazF
MVTSLSAGDIIWVDLSPTSGHEQHGSRPVVVISERAFNAVSGLVSVVPITSTQKGFINEVVISGSKTKGVALIDQIRTIDPVARQYVKKGPISASELREIRSKIAAILGLK